MTPDAGERRCREAVSGGRRERRRPPRCCERACVGGRYWVRTSDLFRVREARYRCANRPVRPRTRGRGWSGRRGSNPRPSPWQGDALPTELRPHIGWADGGPRYAPPTGGANAEAPQCPRSPQGSGCSRTKRLGSGARPVAGARPMWPAGRRLRGSTVARDDEDLGVGRRRSCRLRDLNPVYGPRTRRRQEVRSWVP